MRRTSLRSLTALASSILSSPRTTTRTLSPRAPLLSRFLSAQPDKTQEEEDNDAIFDSSLYALPVSSSSSSSSSSSKVGKEQADKTWDERYRRRAEEVVFGNKEKVKVKEEVEEERDGRRREMLARALLEAALEEPDPDENGEEGGGLGVREEDQKSLSVGIIGAPNAGKSALTNYMVGTKVSAVSRKTNTTTQEVLGVMTKGDTQVCFFDTPGLMLSKTGYPHKDVKARVENAWSAIKYFDVLMVIFDVHRHITRPDTRVVNLIKRVGAQEKTNQKRVLCMNKIDLVEKKKDLLEVSQRFKEVPGYDRYFMISGLKGAGVKDLSEYLMEQAVKKPWDEDSVIMSEEVMKNISLEVVRERLLDHVHQEIPYDIEHRLVDWKELRDGSLRIEQHFITNKESRRMILIGKNGSKIGRIGIEANEELRSIFKREVHLILLVKKK